MEIVKLEWHNIAELESKSYICGHCGNPLASQKGFTASSNATTKAASIYICHYCSRPTYFDHKGKQTPGSPYGNEVKDIPSKEVEDLYQEARNCISCNASTASVLCSRKLLMNIAVSKDADEGLSFVEYVEFLFAKGFIPPGGKEWVDYIRKKGNEATHQISIMEREDAEKLIDFIGMLLKFIYEFPAAIKPKPSHNTE